MKELPILFKGAMVNGLLANIKTQTRRGVKLARWMLNHKELTFDLEKAWKDDSFPQDGEYLHVPASDGTSWRLRCPYGAVGTKLWVRESFARTATHPQEYPKRNQALVVFKADNQGYPFVMDTCDEQPTLYGSPTSQTFDVPKKWKPSIHMPRWASRIQLEITSIRVEKLQDISRGDAMDEGCPFPNMAKGPDPRDWYKDLWESINGKESWDANPWVWCLTFKRVVA